MPKFVVMNDSNDVLAVCDSANDAERFQVETILEWIEYPYRMGIPKGMSDVVDDENFLNELLETLIEDGPATFVETWDEYVREQEHNNLQMVVVEGPEISSSIEPLDNLIEQAKAIYNRLNGIDTGNPEHKNLLQELFPPLDTNKS